MNGHGFVFGNIFNTFKGYDRDFNISLDCAYDRPILEYATPVPSRYLKGNIIGHD